MRSLIKYLLFLALMLFFSCEKTVLFVTCSDCTKEEPKNAVLEIKVDDLYINGRSETMIRIYSGNLEDSVLLDAFNAASTDLTYTATLNKNYTITATYFIKDKKYTTVDAIYPRVKYVTDQCADPCYFVYDKKVNLKLKYSGVQKTTDKLVPDNFHTACYQL
jgi:hypothetical protein